MGSSKIKFLTYITSLFSEKQRVTKSSQIIFIARFFIFLTTQIWCNFVLIFAIYKKIPDLIKLSGFVLLLGFGFYFIVLVEIIFDDNKFSMYRGNLLFTCIIGALSLLHLYGTLIA